MIVHAERTRKPSTAVPAPARATSTAFAASPAVQRLQDTSRALNARPGVVAQRALGARLSAASAVQRVAAPAVAQLMKVKKKDLNKKFVISYGGGEKVATLLSSPGGGWFHFDLDGKEVTVRGEKNILRRADSSHDGSSKDTDDSGSSGEKEEEKKDHQGGVQSHAHLPNSVNDVDLARMAKENNTNVSGVLAEVRHSFQETPRTMRLQYPSGPITISPGRPAFDSPGETGKQPQAMVSYRKNDYEEHQKVGMGYSDWANQLSPRRDDEQTKRERASEMKEFLTTDETKDFSDLDPGQQAALGSTLTTTMVSEPLRTDSRSNATENEFMQHLDARAKGEETFHEIIGSKTDSTFLPARTGGARQQRKRLLDLSKNKKLDLSKKKKLDPSKKK